MKPTTATAMSIWLILFGLFSIPPGRSPDRSEQMRFETEGNKQ